MNNKQYYAIPLVFIALFFLVFFGIRSLQTIPIDKPISTFNVGPTQGSVQTTTADPEVDTWKDYTNDDFNFALSVPADWNQQVYARPNGGTFIAFGPNPLPCGNCTYVHEGYFSVNVYNKKSSADTYADYTNRMTNKAKDPNIQKISFNKIPGVMTPQSIAIENQGWVYELALDKDNGTASMSGSPIFQKVLSSLKFTGLIFTN